MAHNNCTPSRIYGPITQTLFCGCSVKSFSVNAGWNEQASSLVVELVKDECEGFRVWWDEKLDRQTSNNMADPGFTKPEPGCAAYFRIEEDPDGATEADRGGFEYCGIVEGWTESFDANGNPVYSIRITDPRVILENTQVIVGDYPGGTSGVWNMINAYGFVEGLGTACDASEADAIGGVTFDNTLGNIANDRGMNWNDVKCAVHTLTSAVNRGLALSFYEDFCRDNRLVYVGPNDGEENYGILRHDDVITEPIFATIPNANLRKQYYFVDLTEIPFSPDYYRISGPNISLMEIISQVCQDAGCDYYLELLPIKTGPLLLKIIKVRVAVRSSQPTLDILDDFVTEKQKEPNSVTAYTKGEEVRNEPTSIYLMGGKKQEPFEANINQILPFWGVDTDGNLIQAQIMSGEYFVRLDCGKLNTTLYTPFAQQYNWVSESELRAALSDIDSWKHVVHSMSGDFWSHLNAINQTPTFDIGRIGSVLVGALAGHAMHLGLPDAISIDHKIDGDESKDLETIYEFVRSFADEYYGKQFLVNAPFLCLVKDAESDKYRYSHNPSTDGCWVDDNTTTIIGLTHNSVASDFFRDDVGKYQAILRFPLTGGSGIALSSGVSGNYITDPTFLGEDNYITDGSASIWAKADIDERWVSGTPLVPTANTISYLLRINAPVVSRTTIYNDFIWPIGGVDIMKGEKLAATDKVRIIDRGNISYGAVNPAIAPNGALAPTLNNLQVYGPWGVAGLPGQVTLETDEGFVPWEYGSDLIMHKAALDKVNTAVTQMRRGERGSVTLASIPNLPICSELFSADAVTPHVAQGTQKYLGTRVVSTDLCTTFLPHYYADMGVWIGDYGPNITDINVRVGAGGFTTEYQFSTYIPRQGRFNKDNAERLKQIGQTRLNNMRNLRAKNLLKRNIASAVKRGIVERQIGRSSRATKSAPAFLVGRYVAGDRPEIIAQPAKDAGLAFPRDDVYQSGAIMSFDGMFRPVSKAGDGGFSPYMTPGGQDCATSLDNTDQPDPPIKEYTRLSINQTYLDPLANPSTDLPTDRSDTAASGHDIEVLARNTSAPQSGWAIPETQYETDYRFFALRGPMVIQQWGYDLCGKPVPNKADSDANAENGIFVSANLQDKFLNGWLQKPKTWPVAMLDLRLDRERGLWVTPQPPRPVHVTPTGICLLTASGADVDNAKTVYDANGNAIASPTVDVAWPWTIMPPSGVGTIPAYYDNVDCKYYAFPINRLDVQVSGGPTYEDIKKIHFNKGFEFGSVVVDDCIHTIEIHVNTGNLTGNISDDAWCGNPASYSRGFRNLVFGTGFCLSSRDDETTAIDFCAAKIGKSDSGCEAEGMLQAGEGTVAFNLFETLDIGSGLRLIHDGNCDYTLHGGIKIEVDACGLDWPGDWYTKLTIGSGLNTVLQENCDLVIEHPVGVYAVPFKGQTLTHNADCTEGDPSNPAVCLVCTETLNIEGPYCTRKPPKYIDELWAGKGIGFASCGDCDLIIFNNHVDSGQDQSSVAAGTCDDDIVIGQVHLHEWGPDFMISAGDQAGGSCNDLDNTLHTLIELAETNETWSMSFVTGIECTKQGDYIVGIDVHCGSIGGTYSCSNKLWVKTDSITDGNNCGAIGACAPP